MILEFAFRAKITFQRSICQNSVDRSENFLEIFIKRCVVQEFLHELFILSQIIPVKANGIQTDYLTLFNGFNRCCFHIILFYAAKIKFISIHFAYMRNNYCRRRPPTKGYQKGAAPRPRPFVMMNEECSI